MNWMLLCRSTADTLFDVLLDCIASRAPSYVASPNFGNRPMLELCDTLMLVHTCNCWNEKIRVGMHNFAVWFRAC